MSSRIRLSHAAAAILISLVLVAALAPLAAPDPAPVGVAKICVFDTQKIQSSSVAGKNASADLKQQNAQAETQLKSKQQEIQTLQDKIATGRLALAEDQLAQLTKQLDDKDKAYRRFQDDTARDLAARRDALLSDIDAKTLQAVRQIGKERRYAAIFRKSESGLAYVDESLDITALVIRRMDAAAPK